MKKILLLMAAVATVGAASAQPGTWVDLGTIADTSSLYEVPDRAFGVDVVEDDILWFRFSIQGGTSPTGAFFDIDVHSTGTANQADTEIGIYDNSGNRIANDDDDGHSLRSALSFGNTTPRTQPPDPFGWTNGRDHDGRDGNLSADTYWFAIGLFNTTFGDTNWDVTSSSTDDGGTVLVNMRTNAVPEPATLIALGLGASALLRRRKK